MDFGKVVPGPGVGVAKVGKLAKRVELVLHEKTIYTEPRQLDPQTVLVSPCNRDGAPSERTAYTRADHQVPHGARL